MTKPWEDVREEIVQLIRAGESLEQVRALLLKERKFDASVRSYRKKLKQWKLTRHGQFEIQKGSTATSSDATSSIPTISLSSEVAVAASDSLPSPSVNEGHSRNGSVAESTLSAYDPYLSPVSAPSPQRSALSPSDIPRPASSHLEGLFRKLEQAEYGPTMFDMLNALVSPFAPGQQTILHYAVSQDNFWVVDCILDFMISQEKDVDVMNNEGLTALEVAIHSGKKENIESLIRADAKVDRRNPQEGLPIHRAASHSLSADICRILLYHHNSPNELQHDKGKKGPTPLGILVDRVLHSSMGPKKDRLSAMIEVLLEYGGRLSKGEDPYNHDTAILNFVDRWTRWRVPVEGRHSRGFLLGHYFRADCNPLCWFPARHCPQCHSMASYVFSHTRLHLGRLLIECSDLDKFGLQLAERIIKPCPVRSLEKGDPLSSLLQILLKRTEGEGRHGNWDYQLVNEVIEHSPREEQAALLRTLVDWRVPLNSDLRRTFGSLANLTDDKFRLQLAEILLDPPAKVMQREKYEKLMQQYMETHDTAPDAQYLAHELHSTFEVQALQSVQMQPDWLSRERRDRIVQCVVHGLTRFFMTDPSDSISRRWRIEAFRLREKYGLPDLPVSSNVIMSLLPPEEDLRSRASEPSQITNEQPSKHVSGEHGNGARRQSNAGSVVMTDEDENVAHHD